MSFNGDFLLLGDTDLSPVLILILPEDRLKSPVKRDMPETASRMFGYRKEKRRKSE
jgi:hypothetical protein